LHYLGGIKKFNRENLNKNDQISYDIFNRDVEMAMGNKFNVAAFHDELLKDGAMPLNILERKMDAWAKSF